MLLALLLASPASAGPDLPEMAEKYGWSTVASVVQAATTGDVSVSAAHAQLQELGLDRVRVPVRVDPALGDVGELRVLTGCGWNTGVTCALTLPAGSRVPLAWTPRCANAQGIVDSSFIGEPLTAVVDPKPTDTTPGTAHIGDVHTCWLAGGDRVQLVPVGAKPKPRPTLLATRGLPEADATQLLDTHGPALAACMAGHGVIELKFGDGELTLARVLRDGRVQEEETECVTKVVTGATVAAPGAATIKLVVPEG